ncbi:MAG TPA: sulfatase-like hydrolase/transferase [Thermoanaerobaculia bacterium]|nr:sulfatase-like hydrolase/transferase [Thermoanaerobaculia bacterium]
MPRRLLLLIVVAFACAKHETPAPTVARPSILLVTLDTTRADVIGADTPSLNALAARGLVFRQAYTTVPQTLPAHSSIMSGLYPAGHGVHENARFLPASTPLLAERLHAAGYRTAAFVSAFALARRFGLARGFDVYDEEEREGRAERTAAETNERVLAFLRQRSAEPLFLWVHYYDPHFPYTPPEPYASRYAKNPYRGEVAFMDEQLGRLIAAFSAAGPVAIAVVGDHGEGLGEHGEEQHGNLLYQATMHVPLILVGPGVAHSFSDTPVSTRRLFHTILDWTGIDAAQSLRATQEPVILGEAMKPFLDYGWQPQVMTVEGRLKTILSAGKAEVYDVVADPRETRDLNATSGVPRASRAALRDYPLPSTETTPLSSEEQKKLASLGYVASTSKPVIRADAPRPANMVQLFPILDDAASLFVRGEYARAIPLLERILAADPHNLDAALRLATAHSSLGHAAAAEKAFRNAEAIAPDSPDVRTYFALHLARGAEWKRAEPMLERLVSEDANRVPALEALAVIREREGRLPDALELRKNIYAKRTPSAGELVSLGALAMEIGDTQTALSAFERARALQGAAFQHDLELGVLYLAVRRFPDARAALDRIPPTSPEYPMATFKRAQVSVLLGEPDSPARIARAREHADATTRELIARERLFQ